jgi:hypothetical protein
MLDNSSGKPASLVVTAPPLAGNTGLTAPTGMVFSSSSFGGAPFLFATEEGTISAWAGGPNATVQVIGNFGDGLMNAYDPSSGAFAGTLDTVTSGPFF